MIIACGGIQRATVIDKAVWRGQRVTAPTPDMERCFRDRHWGTLRRSVGVLFLTLATAEIVVMSDSSTTTRIVLASRPLGRLLQPISA